MSSAGNLMFAGAAAGSPALNCNTNMLCMYTYKGFSACIMRGVRHYSESRRWP